MAGSAEFTKLVRDLAGAGADEVQRAVLAYDPRVAAVARTARMHLAAHIDAEHGRFAPRHLRALVDVPRERFVRPRDLERAVDDTPLPLDDEALSTISAPHAYLLSFRLLELGPGDHLVELGSGSGYGAALASHIVGPEGSVLTIEIDRELSRATARNVAELRNVKAVAMDAVTSSALWQRATKVVVTFAVERIPSAWTDALAPRGRLVAPVGPPTADQRLVLAERAGDRDGAAVILSDHGGVRYVQNRSAAAT